MNFSGDIRTKKGRVHYLIRNVPATAHNPLLLTLLYWELFEGIKLPKELQQKILRDASDPEVLGRLARLASKHLKEVQDDLGLPTEEPDHENRGTG